MKFNSQHGQDKYLYENFFINKKNGFFVDIGAHDGVDISNTLFYEKELGWSGICIEPMPHRFSSLIKNRNCICVEGCISDFDGYENFIIFPNYTDMLSGMEKTFDKNIEIMVNEKISKNNHKSEIIKVKSYNINSILIENNVKDIDFVSIDTEGSESIILETIDFEKFNINFFTIENNKYDNSIKKIMKSKGFELIEVLGCDELYKNKNL